MTVADEVEVIETAGLLTLVRFKKGTKYAIYQSVNGDKFSVPENVGSEQYIRRLWEKFKKGEKGFLNWNRPVPV